MSLGSLLGASWLNGCLLGASGCLLGAFWVAPVCLLVTLGAPWLPPGCLWGASCVILGASWVLLGGCWVALGRFWVLIGALEGFRMPSKPMCIRNYVEIRVSKILGWAPLYSVCVTSLSYVRQRAWICTGSL